MGACCNGETPCSEVAPTSCVAANDNYFGNGTTCAGLNVECTEGACCHEDQEFCTLESKANCDAMGGIHQLGGSLCTSLIGPGQRVCDVVIVSSRPSEGAVDARQPSNPDGTQSTGLEVIDITFTGNPALLTPADFQVELVPSGAAAPSVMNVAVSGTEVTLQLDGPIPTNQWTRIRHLSSDTVTWLGALPGDVNADRAVNSLDIAAIVACVNDPWSCQVWQCDIDRSGTCAPRDVLRVIDIINGTGVYAGLSAGTLPDLP